jgi:PPE-repeat protein
LAGQAAAHGAAAGAAAAAFEAVHAAITNPAAVFENRTRLMVLVATNFLGINTPAIMATEMQYLEMWAQNIAAMFAYHGASAAAAASAPSFNPLTALTSVLNIFAPGSNQSTTGLAGLLNLLDGSTGSSLGTMLNSTDLNSIFSSGFYTPGSALSPFMSLISGGGDQSNPGMYPGYNQDSYPGSSDSSGCQAAPTGGGGTPAGGGGYPGYNQNPVSARMGAASSVGRLSTPPSWTAASSQAAATPRLTSSVEAAPAATTTGTGTPMVPMMPYGASTGGAFRSPRYGFIPKIIPATYS